MSTRDDVVVLGPFIGGLNNTGDPAAIEDSELVTCNNFIVDTDGTLRSRPPVSTSYFSQSPTVGENVHIIGEGYFASSHYFIGTTSAGTYYMDASSAGSWTLITATVMNHAILFNGTFYMVHAFGGGYWTPSGAYTSDAGNPGGTWITAHKTRLWVNNESSSAYSRIWFTDPLTATLPTWTATNFFDVSPGDGQKIKATLIYNDDLLVLKEDSTWIYAFDLLPEDGLVREVNGDIGVANKSAFTSYENSLYVFYANNVYRLNDYNFTKINEKVRFTSSSASGGNDPKLTPCLSMLDTLLIVSVYNNTYVYNMETSTWTTWTGYIDSASKWYKVENILTVPTFKTFQYLAASSANTTRTVYAYERGNTSFSENIALEIETKTYDFQDWAGWKRLAWWGFNAVTRAAFGIAGTIYIETDDSIHQHISTFNVSTGATARSFKRFFTKRAAYRLKRISFSLYWPVTVSQYEEKLWDISLCLRRKQTITKGEN